VDGNNGRRLNFLELPRKPISRKEFAELSPKHGTAELQTKGLSEEEESQRMRDLLRNCCYGM
jgi:hypothetical protein